MEITLSNAIEDRIKTYKLASSLTLATMLCNLSAGVISVYLGFQDKNLAMIGFGLYSLVGIIYGLGIWRMIKTRARNHSDVDALGTTIFSAAGIAYYAVGLALAIMAGVIIFKGNRPEGAFGGVITPVLFIAFMLFLDNYKTTIARQHNLSALLADANLTYTAYIYPSAILFISSIGYETFSISPLDAIGAFGIAISSFFAGKNLLKKIS